MDVVEIQNITVDPDNGIVILQVYAKRRKKGYMDSFYGMGASLDSPSFF
ncbi:hypothetical protein K7I13_04000 [Brucepastera parasyntrophica]|nr:hypothetical protein [Brucepastera parasyntrophica]ULQ60479.1 hypothetical protein K7I13_04000 [Brucepastera parasyntrophica]